MLLAEKPCLSTDSQIHLSFQKNISTLQVSESDSIVSISLTSQQQATLNHIRQRPPKSNIPWSNILDLLRVVGVVGETKDRIFVLISTAQERRVGTFHCRGRHASVSTIEDLQDLLRDIEICRGESC